MTTVSSLIHRRRFLFVVLSLILSGCVSPVSSEPPIPQVIIQGDTSGIEMVQPIELDNCDGKGDAKRTEHRARSIESTISDEIAASIGASAEVLSAEVQAAVGAAVKQGAERSMSIELSAPPGTRMAFQLVWVGSEQIGIVQNLRASAIPIVFRTFIPTDVRIKSQYDIGCPGSPEQGAPDEPAPPVVDQPNQPEDNDPIPVAPLREFGSEHNVPAAGQSTMNIKVNDGELHIITSGPICVPTVGQCLPGGSNGERRGSVVVLLPSQNTYLLTGLVAQENWHGSYYGLEEQAVDMAQKSASNMLVKRADNVNCGGGCDIVDMLVVKGSSIIAISTLR